MATISYATAGPSRLTSIIPSYFSRTLPSLMIRCSDIGTSKVYQSINSLQQSTASQAVLGIEGVHSSRSLIDSLVELFPPFLLAVPKKKVSHSRKSMRSAHKGLKNKTSECLRQRVVCDCGCRPLKRFSLRIRSRHLIMSRMRCTQAIT
jgi:hypothetical protein